MKTIRFACLSCLVLFVFQFPGLASTTTIQVCSVEIFFLLNGAYDICFNIFQVVIVYGCFDFRHLNKVNGF